jgi:Predicted Zn-dependent proteases and their inactivated homologs
MEDLLRNIVDYGLSQGAKYVEARYQFLTGNFISIKNGVVDNVGNYNIRGVGIRVVFQDSIGFSATNIINKESLINACNNAIKIARNSKKRNVKFDYWRDYHDICIVKPKVENRDIEEIINEFKENDKRIVETENRTVFRVFFITKQEEEKLFVNSEGSVIQQKWPIISLFCSLAAVDHQKGFVQRFLHDGGKKGWEIISEIEYEEKLKNEAKILGKILNEAETLKEKGEYDVIIDGEITGLISHEACGHPFEADRILGREAAQGGESYLNLNMLNKEKLGSELLNIVDDPTIEKSSGFYVYDDEGIPARKRYLIKDGIPNEVLLNREYAGYLSTKSNSAARATYYYNEPLIRMANTYIEPKDFTVDEMIEDVKRGIYLKSYMEWNIDDRRWNQKYTGLECYLIENGQIKKNAKKCSSGNNNGTFIQKYRRYRKRFKVYTR